MPLRSDEIVPGAIAYLSAPTLYADVHRVSITGTYDEDQGRLGMMTDPELRPFLCIEADPASSAWTPITTQFKSERLPIRREWVRHGYGKLGRGETYLMDGAIRFAGPHGSFTAAGAQEIAERFRDGARPSLTPEGVEAVRHEMESQTHRAIAVDARTRLVGAP